MPTTPSSRSGLIPKPKPHLAENSLSQQPLLDINILILQYLKEHKMNHSAFCFGHEAQIQRDPLTAPRRLLQLVKRGLAAERNQHLDLANSKPGSRFKKRKTGSWVMSPTYVNHSGRSHQQLGSAPRQKIQSNSMSNSQIRASDKRKANLKKRKAGKGRGNKIHQNLAGGDQLEALISSRVRDEIQKLGLHGESRLQNVGPVRTPEKQFKKHNEQQYFTNDHGKVEESPENEINHLLSVNSDRYVQQPNPGNSQNPRKTRPEQVQKPNYHQTNLNLLPINFNFPHFQTKKNSLLSNSNFHPSTTENSPILQRSSLVIGSPHTGLNFARTGVVARSGLSESLFHTATGSMNVSPGFCEEGPGFAGKRDHMKKVPAKGGRSNNVSENGSGARGEKQSRQYYTVFYIIFFIYFKKIKVSIDTRKLLFSDLLGLFWII